MNVIKTKKVGGKAYPNDFNWECPFCGNENRAFQLPPRNEDGFFSEEDLKQACQYCSHENR